MKCVSLIIAALLVVQVPARAGLVLVAGPNQGSFTNNFGFGADGTGSATNPNANYFVGGAFGSHLNNAPVAILFVFGTGGAVSTYADSSVGTYDNIEDTQIGVLNLSGTNLAGFKLSGAGDLFGFDGDGISSAYGGNSSGFGAGAPGNASDPSKYGGPLAFFSLTAGGTAIGASGSSATSAFVNFINGGLPSGSSTYFSLEGTPGDLSGIGATSTVPEPASLALFGIIAVGMAAHGWRRRTHAAA